MYAFVQLVILVVDVKYVIVHVISIRVCYLIMKLICIHRILLGLNGGVCQSTSSGGVICVCPTGYTGVRWYVFSIDLCSILFFFQNL